MIRISKSNSNCGRDRSPCASTPPQLEDCQRILIVSRDAPFGKLTIDWQFTPQAQDYCEIRVAISLELHAGPLKYPLSRLLAHSGDELLPLFEKRAHSLYSAA